MISCMRFGSYSFPDENLGILMALFISFASPCTEEDWNIIHCMLVSWITNTIHPEVSFMLSRYDSVKCLWDDLHECFSMTNTHTPIKN